MPEGDTLHRAARRLQVLVGEQVDVETPHPRARASIDVAQFAGRRLESAEAFGKNLVLRFEGGLVLRSHLRMSGRWTVRPRGRAGAGRPWLVLRGATTEAVLWNGPVLEPHARALASLGPDILAVPPDFEAMLARIDRAESDRRFGDILQDQRLIAGIGNMWMAETLWHARLSPWLRLSDVARDNRLRALETAAALMRASVDDGRVAKKNVHGRARRACPRCGTPIRSWGQGDANRIAYWCPACQPGAAP
jgi:endonuclease-8